MRSFSSQKEAVIFECTKKKLQVTDYRGFGVNTEHLTKITVPSFEGFFYRLTTTVRLWKMRFLRLTSVCFNKQSNRELLITIQV